MWSLSGPSHDPSARKPLWCGRCGVRARVAHTPHTHIPRRTEGRGLPAISYGRDHAGPASRHGRNLHDLLRLLKNVNAVIGGGFVEGETDTGWMQCHFPPVRNRRLRPQGANRDPCSALP